MFRRKLFTGLVLSSLPFLPGACSSEFEDCRTTRTCPAAGQAGKGSSGAGTGGLAGSSGSVGTAGKSGGSGGASAGRIGGGDAGAETADAGQAGAINGSGGRTGQGGDAGEGGGAEPGGGDAGSEAGSGGEAGSSAKPCERDDDCSDSKFCTGIEKCEDGTCKNGQPVVCQNPDGEHCSARCTEGETSAVCVVEALDDDEDGFTAEGCVADPGNDCDDAESSVNPDAAESCDGIDNDCNGLIDTLDGLALAGTRSDPIEQVNTLDLAWSPTTQAFGAIFDNPPESALFFATLLTNGVWVGGTSPIIEPGGYYQPFWPHIVWGGQSFGISWTTAHPSGVCSVPDGNYCYWVDMTNVSVGGSVGTLTPRVDGIDNDIAVRSDGEFVVTNTTSRTLHLSHFKTGSEQTGPQIATQVYNPHITALGNESAVVWHDNAGKIFFRRADADLAPLGTQATLLGEGGHYPEIAATSDGYAVAWLRDGGLLGFSRLRANGTPICSKTDVNLGFTPDLSEHVVVGETEYGTLVLFTHNNGKVLLYRFGADCSVTAQYTVDQLTSSSSPTVAVGGGKVAIGWRDTGAAKAYTRVFGERLCE